MTNKIMSLFSNSSSDCSKALLRNDNLTVPIANAYYLTVHSAIINYIISYRTPIVNAFSQTIAIYLYGVVAQLRELFGKHAH